MGKVAKSPWIMHYDASSCNGCDIEVLACLTPVYDAERFGVINCGDPFQADILLITGGVNKQNAPIVKQLYDQMAEPKVVCAIGVCACTGGIFKECYNILGGVDTVIPVDVYIPGCAARPQAILDGVVKAVGIFQQKADEMDKNKKMKPAPQAAPVEEKAEEAAEPVVQAAEPVAEAAEAVEEKAVEAGKEVVAND
ncbi:MAG: NADH-quinone oxidoreductase subunit NuoB [Lachnospiraceae bacterium]|nr:NADH-quinone oxidoreductase subunit NuoB [Lachnospiraceae bacterium]